MSRRDAKRNIVRNKYKQEYIYGNVVKKADRDYNIEVPKQVEKRKNIKKSSIASTTMDRTLFVIFFLAMSVVLYMCISYLKIQYAMTESIKNIEKSEKRLETLVNENNALETRINTYIDLANIYEVATKELGMVYANKGQIIQYEKTESEYVRQYEDIPQ